MFVITTNPASRGTKWTNPLWWSSDGLVGIMRAREAQQFNTVEQAFAQYNRIPLADRAFHDLAVVEVLYQHDLSWQPPRRWA